MGSEYGVNTERYLSLETYSTISTTLSDRIGEDFFRNHECIFVFYLDNYPYIAATRPPWVSWESWESSLIPPVVTRRSAISLFSYISALYVYTLTPDILTRLIISIILVLDLRCFLLVACLPLLNFLN